MRYFNPRKIHIYLYIINSLLIAIYYVFLGFFFFFFLIFIHEYKQYFDQSPNSTYQGKKGFSWGY